MIIDVHNHYIPEEMARALGAEPGKPVTVMEGGIPKRKVHDRQFIVEKRLKAMEEAGISVQLVSCTAGWNAPLEKCQVINDQLSKLQNQYKGKLIGLADVPLGGSDSDKEAIQELHRAMDKLKLGGVSIPAQPFGIPMDDKRFWSFYKEVESLKVGVFIHPSPIPGGFDALAKYDLHRIVGREFDLVTAICRIIFGGVIDKFPDIKLVFAHFGGGISAFLERIEPRGNNWQVALPRDFIKYVKRLYFDAAGFTGGMNAFRLAYEVLGPSQLLFGSDYPQDFLEGEEIKTYIDNIKKYLKGKDDEGIMSKNAISVFGLTPNS